MATELRPFHPRDTRDCVEVYRDAIHNGTGQHYTDAQKHAWAPLDEGGEHEAWTDRLAQGITVVAISDGVIAGFATLTEAGHLDLFFVRPDARPLGIADDLYERVLSAARGLGLARLTTHASHLARRFLERRGWVVLQEEQAMRHGLLLTRFEMALKAVDRGKV